MIPLEKLIEYKGNRYELSKAMIELARNGKDLLTPEVKHKKAKYISVAIDNVLNGKIKYDYTDSTMSVDKYAPYKSSEEEYDESIYMVEEEESIVDEIEEEEEEEYYVDEEYDEEEEEESE